MLLIYNNTRNIKSITKVLELFKTQSKKHIEHQKKEKVQKKKLTRSIDSLSVLKKPVKKKTTYLSFSTHK